MKQIFWMGGGVGVLILILLTPICLRVVPPGFTGVVTSFGRVEPVPLASGMSVVAPWKKVVLQDIRVQVFDDEYECASADMQAFQVRFILNFRRNSDETPELFRNVGDSLEILQGKILGPAVQNSLKSVMGKYRISELSEQRPEVIESIRDEIEAWITPYHLTLLEVSLADLQFSEMYRSAVEIKQVEEQRAEKAKYELTRTGTEAKINEVKAQGEAEARAEEARGESEALKIRAKAEAGAIEMEAAAQSGVYRSLAQVYRPNLLLRDQVEIWNGRVTQVTVGSGDILPFSASIPTSNEWNEWKNWASFEPAPVSGESTPAVTTASDSLLSPEVLDAVRSGESVPKETILEMPTPIVTTPAEAVPTESSVAPTEQVSPTTEESVGKSVDETISAANPPPAVTTETEVR